MTRTRLEELACLATDLDRLASASMEELYGAAELEEQRQMMLTFEKSQNINSAIEESKKEPQNS